MANHETKTCPANCLVRSYCCIIKLFDQIALPLYLLFIRFWMAKIFWESGLNKISSWQSTLYLFQYEYKPPILPTELAAYISTFFELVCPVLLLFGLATRLATLPLLAMTAVIQYTYPQYIEHYYWAMLFALILFYGPGKLSLDYLICKKCCKK